MSMRREVDSFEKIVERIEALIKADSKDSQFRQCLKVVRGYLNGYIVNKNSAHMTGIDRVSNALLYLESVKVKSTTGFFSRTNSTNYLTHYISEPVQHFSLGAGEMKFHNDIPKVTVENKNKAQLIELHQMLLSYFKTHYVKNQNQVKWIFHCLPEAPEFKAVLEKDEITEEKLAKGIVKNAGEEKQSLTSLVTEQIALDISRNIEIDGKSFKENDLTNINDVAYKDSSNTYDLSRIDQTMQALVNQVGNATDSEKDAYLTYLRKNGGQGNLLAINNFFKNGFLSESMDELTLGRLIFNFANWSVNENGKIELEVDIDVKEVTKQGENIEMIYRRKTDNDSIEDLKESIEDFLEKPKEELPKIPSLINIKAKFELECKNNVVTPKVTNLLFINYSKHLSTPARLSDNKCTNDANYGVSNENTFGTK